MNRSSKHLKIQVFSTGGSRDDRFEHCFLKRLVKVRGAGEINLGKEEESHRQNLGD